MEEFEDFCDGFGDGELVGTQFQFRAGRRFVGSGDTGEIVDFLGAGFGVKTLGVALLAHGERGVDEDLDEPARRHYFSHEVMVGAVRRNKGGDADQARIGEELSRFADAADVFGPVFRRKGEVRAEAVAHAVAVQDVNLAAEVEQLALQLGGDGGFAGAGQLEGGAVSWTATAPRATKICSLKVMPIDSPAVA